MKVSLDRLLAQSEIALGKERRWELQRRAGKQNGISYSEVAGGNYRLIASFDFRRQIVFVKFIGTHAEYDAIDPLTVARF